MNSSSEIAQRCEDGMVVRCPSLVGLILFASLLQVAHAAEIKAIAQTSSGRAVGAQPDRN